MPRAQAEVLATTIIVSVAVIVALGLVYYLSPQLSRLSASHRASMLLSTYSASLGLSPLSSLNSSSVLVYSFGISNSGTIGVRVFLVVVPFMNGLPAVLNYTYSFYIMTNSSAVLAPGQASGWAPVPSLNVSTSDVFLYIRDGYYSLRDSGYTATSITLYDVGIVRPGGSVVVKLDLSGPSIASYVAALLVAVNGKYYEVGRYVVHVPA